MICIWYEHCNCQLCFLRNFRRYFTTKFEEIFYFFYEVKSEIPRMGIFSRHFSSFLVISRHLSFNFYFIPKYNAEPIFLMPILVNANDLMDISLYYRIYRTLWKIHLHSEAKNLCWVCSHFSKIRATLIQLFMQSSRKQISLLYR